MPSAATEKKRGVMGWWGGGMQEREDVWKSGKWSDMLVDFNSSAAFEHSMSILIGQSEQRRRLFAAETVRLGSAAKDAAWKLPL